MKPDSYQFSALTNFFYAAPLLKKIQAINSFTNYLKAKAFLEELHVFRLGSSQSFHPMLMNYRAAAQKHDATCDELLHGLLVVVDDYQQTLPHICKILCYDHSGAG